VAVSRHDYDLNGNLLKAFDAEDNDGDGNREATTYTYDGFDRLTRVTNALGNQTENTYDVVSNIVRVQETGHPANQPTAVNVLHTDVSYSHDEMNRRFQVDESLFVADGFTPSNV